MKLFKFRPINYRKIAAGLFEWIPDAAMLAGFVMVGYGLYLIYPPAMWIICGLGVFMFGFPHGRKK